MSCWRPSVLAQFTMGIESFFSVATRSHVDRHSSKEPAVFSENVQVCTLLNRLPTQLYLTDSGKRRYGLTLTPP